MTDYKKAKCIELHDSNISLTTNNESYAFTAPLGRTEDSDKPAFCIQFNDIAMLAEMLGIGAFDDVKARPITRQDAGDPNSRDKRENISTLEIPILKKHFSLSDEEPDIKITQLECQIISDRLINIRITAEHEESAESIFENMTYGGNFTIWWE